MDCCNDCCKDCCTAAKNGHLECLKNLHQDGHPLNETVITTAASLGHLDCVIYAHKNGCPWNNIWTCYWAASNGQLDCLKYLHQNDCHWNEETTSIAAAKGNLKCLIYAHQNGCPWNSFSCRWAADNYHLDCLKYAYQNKCPRYDEYFDMVRELLLKENLSMFWAAIKLRIYIARFIKKYYTPGNKGFILCQNHFTNSQKRMDNNAIRI